MAGPNSGQVGSGNRSIWLQDRVSLSAGEQVLSLKSSAIPGAFAGLASCGAGPEGSGSGGPVPHRDRFRGFYSNLFTVPRKEGKVRPILDLKALNRFVRLWKFRMESLRSVVASLNPGDFLASIDLKDAYLHIPIFEGHQR